MRAVEVALRGSSYQTIADELGYANRGTVYPPAEKRAGRPAVQVAIWGDAVQGT
jgi:hypothetical protein